MRPGNVVNQPTITPEPARSAAPPTSNRVPEAGQVVRVRTRTYLVGPVGKQSNGSGTLVRLACLDDDAQGQPLDVVWELELAPETLDREAWQSIGKHGFDNVRHFSAFIHTLRWNCVTATDPRIFQAPFRAGIRLDAYLVGEEINTDPNIRPKRFVIYLSDIVDEPGLDKWPELKAIVQSKVKPERLSLGSNPNNVPLKKRWWAYQAHRPELYAALARKQRVLCLSRVGQALAFAFAETGIVFSEAVVVFDLDSDGAFAVLQSRPHEMWARFFASSMKDDMRYTPSDCFETFPFPAGWETNAALETAGREYYDLRAALMVGNNQGLTKTYNRFHDPEETSPDILRLRELHAAMDRAVLEAYGWPDLIPQCQCEFLLDYEDEEDGAEDTGRRRKKPWRYRWPNLVRDEVLAHLLKLNAERAEQERLVGLTAAGRKKPNNPRAKTPSAAPAQGEIIPSPQKDLFAG